MVPPGKIKVAAVSDTHGKYYPINPVDLLLVAGDVTNYGGLGEFLKFRAHLLKWRLYIPKIILVPGNHDMMFQEDEGYTRALLDDLLIDEEYTYKGFKFYGHPWTVEFGKWAFMDNVVLDTKAAMIPEGLDVLISHGPPFGLLDKTNSGWNAGDEYLRDAINIKKPRYHVFGHIHEAAGQHVEDGYHAMNVAQFPHYFTLEER